MDVRRHNQDLRILQREERRWRFGRWPAWQQVDWKPDYYGGNTIYLRQVSLPPACSMDRTDIKVEAPPNLYDPIGDRFVFYRNVWISPGLTLYDERTATWRPVPRLYDRDSDGFAYLCLHPDPVTAEKNILDFIRVFDLFLINPRYKSAVFDRERAAALESGTYF